MAFYDDLSSVYDDLFPVSPAQTGLFESLRKEYAVVRMADAGCGSGAQILPFAQEGVACVGFDPDPAMVALALRKLSGYPGVRIEQGGFSDMTRIVDLPADLLLCLGNSLVHVPQDEARGFVADAGKVVRPGGAFLLQILNYERLDRWGITELPLMTAADGVVEFRRQYAWEGRDRILFRTILRISGPDGPRIFRNEIPLYPLYPDDLYDHLLAAGFSPRFHGDFLRAEFTIDSEALVCAATRT